MVMSVRAGEKEEHRIGACFLFWYFAGTAFLHTHTRTAEEQKKEHESVMNGTIMEHDILFVCFIWITPEIKCTHWNRRYLTHESKRVSGRMNERQNQRQTIDGRHPMSNTYRLQNNNNCIGQKHTEKSLNGNSWSLVVDYSKQKKLVRLPSLAVKMLLPLLLLF